MEKTDTYSYGGDSEIVAITQQLADQTETIRTLRETIELQMQTIIYLKNDILNLNNYVAFLTRQVALVADGQPVPELLSVVQSYNEFKHTKTH